MQGGWTADPHAGLKHQQACIIQSSHTRLLYLSWAPSSLDQRVSHSMLGGECLIQLHFQDQNFSWNSSKYCFSHLGVDFLRFHKLLIDPCSHAMLDSVGRRLPSLAWPSPPTATVVVVSLVYL
jgi:hypothetical protein